MPTSSATPPSWDHPRRARGLGPLLDYGAALGIDGRRLLHGTGLLEADVADGTPEVSAQQELRVIRSLVELAGSRVSGAELGAHYGLSTYGVLGFAISTSPTVQRAIEVGLRFLELSFAFSEPTARLDGDRVRLDVDPGAGLPGPLARLLAERDLAAIARLIDESTGGAVAVSIDRSRRSLSFDVAWLAAPMPRSDPEARKRCEAVCLDAVTRRRARTGTAQEVRARITRHLAAGSPAAAVAADLGCSERTLRRRLAGLGTSYRELLDEVRSSVAEELLATGVLTVGDIAVRLGYAESASFIHAYGRWSGHSPRARERPAAAGTGPPEGSNV